MFSWFIPAASSYAGDVDILFLIITLTVGFWFLLTEAAFFFLMSRFQRKEGKKAIYMTGEGHEKHWIHIPHYLVIVCDVFLIVGAIMVWNTIKIDKPENPDAKIRVIAQQWAWTFVQPGLDGKLDTPDDIITVDELHVQKDLTYVFELQSKDVLHNFSVPAFRLKQDAVPGRTIEGWFKPILRGEFDIQCAEMCGVAHGIMGARLHIEDPDEHLYWMNKNTPASVASL
jgi:cytochrome c oxidase subunit 2